MSDFPYVPTLTTDDLEGLTAASEEYRYILNGEVFVKKGANPAQSAGTVDDLQSGLQPGYLLVQGMYCTY